MNQIQFEMKTKIGPLYLVASEHGLRGVFWRKQQIKSAKILDPSNTREKFLLDTARQLKEYLAGERREFDLVLDLSGTSFQEQVWRELTQIPFGETVSYSDVARKMKNPKAVRAVGTANGKNPIGIIIPCHRVISANGSMGGYSGGVDIKRRLLELEREGNIR